MEEANPTTVAKHCFISHSSEEAGLAAIVVRELEAKGVKCWVAPRDIRPGGEYPAEILRGMKNSHTLLLLLSAKANESPHVLREVEQAVAAGIKIIPLRVENIKPAGSLAYLAGLTQWVDAFEHPREKSLAAQAGQLAGFIAGASDKVEERVAVLGPRPDEPRRGSRRWWIGAGAVAALALAGYFLYPKDDPGRPAAGSDLAKWTKKKEFALSVEVKDPKPVHKEGTEIRFKVTAAEDCYVALILSDSKGDLRAVWPYERQGAYISSKGTDLPLDFNNKKAIPPFLVAPPFGEDTVFAIAFTNGKDYEEFKETFFDALKPIPSAGDVKRGLAATEEMSGKRLASWASVKYQTAP